MEVNMDQEIVDRNGHVIKTGDGKSLTLSEVCCISIDQGLADSRDSSLKYKMGKLAHSLYKGGVVNLKTDEIAQLKELIGKVMMPHVVLKAHDLLEGINESKA